MVQDGPSPPPGPSRQMYWVLMELWTFNIGQRAAPLWIIVLLRTYVFHRLFSGLPPQLLQDLRWALLQQLPVGLMMPLWLIQLVLH